jgi:hypothetical protein
LARLFLFWPNLVGFPIELVVGLWIGADNEWWGIIKRNKPAVAWLFLLSWGVVLWMSFGGTISLSLRLVEGLLVNASPSPFILCQES